MRPHQQVGMTALVVGEGIRAIDRQVHHLREPRGAVVVESGAQSRGTRDAEEQVGAGVIVTELGASLRALEGRPGKAIEHVVTTGALSARCAASGPGRRGRAEPPVAARRLSGWV
jgi:hypothetical protein